MEYSNKEKDETDVSDVSDMDEDVTDDVMDNLDNPDEDSSICSSTKGPVFLQQITEEEYFKQKYTYTRNAIEELLKSEDYKRWFNKCSSCGISWYHQQFNPACQECGGFALERFCPICQGRCGSVWQRDVDMSHSMKSAHWDGKCLLPEPERQAYMMRFFVEDNEDVLADAMEDLGKT